MIDPQRGLILWWSLSAIVLLLLTPRCSAALFRPGSAVQMLSSPADFQSKVKNGDEPWIVNFGADWCGPCKNFAPQYEQAAGMLRGQYNFGAVDCTKSNPIASGERVNSFPTVKIYKGKGAPGQEYPGGRDANSVVNYMKRLPPKQAPRPQPQPQPQPQPRPQPQPQPQPQPRPPQPQPRPQPQPQPRPRPRPQPEEEVEEEEYEEEEEEPKRKPRRKPARKQLRRSGKQLRDPQEDYDDYYYDNSSECRSSHALLIDGLLILMLMIMTV